MNHTDRSALPGVQAPSLSRRARLHALLFTGRALGTTLLADGATANPKLPPYVGE